MILLEVMLVALLAHTAFASTRPNVVFILADDLDSQLRSLDYLPHVKSHLIDKGTHFRKHYCTNAFCCPSRVSLWTGKAAHNTNVTDGAAPYGGYSKFISEGLNDNWLPVWLEAAGYNSYYVGKLFNSHTPLNYNKPFPAGFKGSDFLLDPWQYQYWNPGFQRNTEAPMVYSGQYSTDLVAQKSFDFLDDAVKEDKPFFLTIAPIAPHIEVNITVDEDGSPNLKYGPPNPAPRHKGLFADAKVPRTANFNPKQASGAAWVARLPLLNQTSIDKNDEFYRDRLRAVQGVDEIVDTVFTKLDQYGILNNTYIFFSSDNGYHIGQHRLLPGKKCGYEEDINVPLIVRGPGVTEKREVDLPTSHLDLAPTFLDILGIPLRSDFDGAPIPLWTEGTQKEHVQIEYWGKDDPNEYLPFLVNPNFNNTYKAIRLVGPSYSLYYSVWCTNEHELYDMTDDPGQLNNLLAPNATPKEILGVTVPKLTERLDALLYVLKSCKGEVCRHPWKALRPDGKITSLVDAVAKEHDVLFACLPKVSFSACLLGYLTSAEGPQFRPKSDLRARRLELDGGDVGWALLT